MASTQLYEKIVKVKNAKQKAILISAILAYVLYLSVWIFVGILNPEKSILIFLFGGLSCALIVGITWKYLFVEYEYCFCQGQLTISKIYGKKSRKHLADTNMQKLLFIAPATDETIKQSERYEPEKRLIAVSSEYADNIWLLVTGEEDETRLLIFIEADERALSILKSSAPHIFPKKIG